ncbi:unnamed protein product [Candidula unifasciata]|uniref:Uncharacterized protein n=1 Tax=Candidula unifasciata TaxID=100452 RepID=A0A8S3YJZ7_9EUPU|nr:unnamed protein product [Candidula unifasciata]
MVLQAVKKDPHPSASSPEGQASKEKREEATLNTNKLNSEGNSTVSGESQSGITNNNAENLEWNLFYYFDPTERFRNLEEFFPCFDVCFTNVTKLPFHTSPRAIRFSNGRLVGIVNAKLLQENDEGELVKSVILKETSADNSNSSNQTTCQGLEPLIEAYAKYFPQFPLEDLLPALNNWQAYQSKAEGPSHVDY